jgi:hypothetical protein
MAGLRSPDCVGLERVGEELSGPASAKVLTLMDVPRDGTDRGGGSWRSTRLRRWKSRAGKRDFAGDSE